MAILTAVFSAPFLGGSEIFNLEFLRVARDRGVSLHAVVPDHGPLEEALRPLVEQIEIAPLPAQLQSLSRFDERPQPASVAAAAAALAGYLRTLRRALNRTSGPVCCLGFRSQLAVAAARVQRPVAWVVHEIVPNGRFGRLWALAARQPELILAFSEAAAKQPLLAEHQVQILSVRLDLAEQLALPLPVPPVGTLGLIGDLIPLKNHLALLAIVKELRDSGVRCSGLLVGRDTSDLHSSREYVTEVRAAVAASDGAARLVSAQPEEVPALLAQMDMVIHLSTVPESFGRVCVEALAAGRPVVAFAHGAIPEVVEEGRSGLLCPPGDVHAVATAARRLIADPTLYGSMSGEARDRARLRWGPGQSGPTVGEALAEFAQTSTRAAR